MLFDGATLESFATAVWVHCIGYANVVTIRAKRECIIVAAYLHPPRITARIASAYECSNITTCTNHRGDNCIGIRRTASRHHLPTHTAANWGVAWWIGCVSAGPWLWLSCANDRYHQKKNECWLHVCFCFLMKRMCKLEVTDAFFVDHGFYIPLSPITYTKRQGVGVGVGVG